MGFSLQRKGRRMVNVICITYQYQLTYLCMPPRLYTCRHRHKIEQFSHLHPIQLAFNIFLQSKCSYLFVDLNPLNYAHFLFQKDLHKYENIDVITMNKKNDLVQTTDTFYLESFKCLHLLSFQIQIQMFQLGSQVPARTPTN